jgi:hypothetical protein
MYDDRALATPFETWCETHGIRPDDPDAWSLYERETTLSAS